MKNQTLALAFLASTVGAMAGGCSTFQKKDESLLSSTPKKSLLERMPWSKDEDEMPEPYPNPVKLASTWVPDTLTQTGRVPTRGFGARVFFYDEKSRAVPVEGTLIVVGFDETETREDGTPVVKRYEFTPEQFTRHFSQSDLGASYSVWIPWDAVGGKQTRVSLVASFKTKEGKVVQGTPTKVLLPGKKESAEATLAQRYAPEYREWKVAAAGNSKPNSGLTTTTIQRSTPAARAIPETSTPPSYTPSWSVATSKTTTGFDVSMKPNAGTPVDRSNGTAVMPASSKINR
ncbi:MAG: hypothetical protein ACF787_00620 [Rhodopirellula sp. JB053]